MKRPLFLILFLLVLTGCQGSYALPEPDITPDNPPVSIPVDSQPADDVEQDTDPDFAAIGVNELGKVMVLMYHEIGNPEATWTRTPDNFRQDMETLYQEGYRPVNLTEFLSGNIDIPVGTSPFILTFDDGTAGQFRFIEQDGERVVDPQSAVGILLHMAEKYEDFTPAGTFYIYYPLPFRQKEYISEKLELLTTWGFEIGNHSFNHENLAKVPPQEAIQSLAKHVRSTQNFLPGYQVRTLALPYGARPKDNKIIVRNSWDGTEYHNEAILLVGANPARSPFDKKFDPLRLPRVRADGTELSRWIDHFRNKPEERYISDGDPNTVTIPQHQLELLEESKLKDKNLRTY